jgi:hypothetical protein
MNEAQAKLGRRFRGQADACAALGSDLYASLLNRAADDLERAGPVWRAAEPLAALPGGAVPALRFMGAAHRLALNGAAPELAAHYPSCGGDGDHDGAWAALIALAEREAGTDPWLSLLDRGVQTNEVGRSAALLGGFLAVARSTGLPLRLLEVGASAGLNLRWDRFRYGDWWGPIGAAVDHGDPWIGSRRPDLSPATVAIADRRGCDIAPLDPASSDGRLTLLSFVWPDMRRRFELLEGACRIAADLSVPLEQESADAWLARHLIEAVDGVATVVFHSVFIQYMESEARGRLLASIQEAGMSATVQAPLAWLRLEPPGQLGPPDFEVRLTTWPGGEDVRLATAHPHGIWVRWEA